ncbi:Pup--protein ligase [Dermatophilus congolensis]|uniref:Pup--protein ligase n=2 Tax=Dermatophilus congolensis TaxID=1863 RepID=UPI001AAECDE1|nr:Pup--protein ligase [Dermatophilus congolensis]MBO3131951.1 Pup--protein ligase [Dermatophilus congolensis]MBO3133893.1 Pup--protein ligase [Dermatophilus congolensis]MBO3136123.1 Pup--protein ligase [Dermatophilus congolensis]MBO3138367.1 Pup--protein ligase [Dermatophilus congolensis]
MTSRVMGVETEYGVSFTYEGRRRLSGDEAARAMFRDIIGRHRTSNVFTDSGARLYLDVGNHPEYATAECTDVFDLVAHDRAGELIMDELAGGAVRRLAQDGIEGTFRVLKNNLDSVGNSYGCHENYLVRRSGRVEALSELLAPFLVTRQIFCGAGRVVRPQRGADEPVRFDISQRAEVVWEGVSHATTRSRPMINARDEPHADANMYRRLHVIVGDSTMTQTSTLLKVGTTELVLRVLESGAPAPVVGLASNARAIRAISRDPWSVVSLADGKRMRAVEVQRAFYAAVVDYLDRVGVSGPADERVLQLWDGVLTAVESRDWAVLSRQVDWAVKRRVLDRFMERHGTDLQDARVAALDLLFHDVRPGQGLFAALERAGEVDVLISDARAREAMTVPPRTRAVLRGAVVVAARQAGLPCSVDWARVQVGGGVDREVELLDPFATHDEQVEQLLVSMRGDGGVVSLR